MTEEGFGEIEGGGIMERGKYKGWIIADYKDKEFLERLGIKLGRYDEEFTSFEDCELSPETLGKLDPYWGKRFYWGLEWRPEFSSAVQGVVGGASPNQ